MKESGKIEFARFCWKTEKTVEYECFVLFYFVWFCLIAFEL